MKKIYMLLILINFNLYSNNIIYFSIEDLESYNTIMLIIHPKTGIIKEASKGAFDYYGYKNLIGMNIDQINLLSNKEIEEEMNKAYNEERNFFNFKHKLSEGEIRNVQVNSYPMKYNGQDILLSRVIDVTHIKRQEAFISFIKKTSIFILLLLSITFYFLSKKFKKIIEEKILLIENIPEILYVYSTKNGGIYYSHQLQNILGYTQEDFKKDPKLWQNSILKEDTNIIKKAINNAINGKGFNIEYRIKNKLGKSIYLNDRSIMLEKKNNDTIITGLAADISNIKKREKELIYAREIAEKANKTKSEFLSNMSHEIRTPINGINGFLDLLIDMENNNEKKDYLQIIKESSDHLLSIINDILCISKIEAGKLEIKEKEVNIIKKIELISKSFIKQAESKNLEFILEIDKSFNKSILIDEYSILKIINNLVSNSIKFTHQGYIKLSLKNIKNKQIELIVKDSGTGINKKKQKKLFEPFEQGEDYLTKQYGGTGLGLSIVKRIVDLLNGEIFVETEIGAGTKFKLLIPYKKAKNENYSDNIKSENINIKLPLKIISAEDMEINQKLIEKYLEKENIYLKKVRNGQELLEELEQNYYDLILLDIQMPVLNGLEATKLLKNNKLYKNIPIIATSAAAFEENIKEMYEAGIDDHISKPIEKSILINKIIKWAEINNLRNKE